MRELTKKELQETILEILVAFDSYCRAHNLRYYLSGGTLLGAIRHHGFIPWDDDIDVCMPRPDYERMISEFPAILAGRYVLCAMARGNFNRPFAKIVDTRTVLADENLPRGEVEAAWMDIMPVDGLPADIAEVTRIYKKMDRLRFMMGLATMPLNAPSQRWYKRLVKPFAIAALRLVGPMHFVREMESLAARYQYEASDYVGAITWGLYGPGERMKKSEFEQAIEVDFAGHRLRTFACYESYLRGIYGDYMQLPPVEQRITHSLVAYLKEDEG